MWAATKIWRRVLDAIPFNPVIASLLVLLCAYLIYSTWVFVNPLGDSATHLAGGQRVLLERIAGETLLLVEERSSGQRVAARQRAVEALSRFRLAQNRLESVGGSLDWTGENTATARNAMALPSQGVERLASAVEAIQGLGPQGLMRLSNASSEVREILGPVESLSADYEGLLPGNAAGTERIEKLKVLKIAGILAAVLLVLQALLVAYVRGKQIKRLRDRLHRKERLLRREILARRRSDEGHRLMAAAFEQANDSIVVTDAGGNVRYVNAAFARNTGYSKEEILGKTQSMLKSGEQDAEFYRRMWNTISSGQPWRGQMVNRRKDGALRTESQAVFPIRDRMGQITHYAGIKRDITREVEMEKQLRESQRLEAIGVLAGGVAHDFNNILTPIIGFTDLTLGLVPEHSEAHDNLVIVRTAAQRAKDTVMLIRNAVRENASPPQPIQLEDIAKEVVTLMRSTASKSIAIAQDIPQRLPTVLGDPSAVHRLLMNLCVNACQAMPQGGRLTIALSAVRLAATTGYLAGPAPGDFIRIEVKDTGHGMSEKTMPHIFEPYFTTRQGSTGTGLGLFVVFNIVKQLKGGIRVASRENAGTTFEIILPVPQSHPAPAEAPGQLEAPGHGRILFIDDEEMVVKLARSALERLGYCVTAMSDPIAASALFEQDPGRFDVVFTDRTMPGMNGDAVLKRIKAIRPELPVILCTGLYDTHGEKNALAMGFDACLEKPFALSELSASIASVLPVPSTSARSTAQAAPVPAK